jgi:hypothetical protein
VRLLHSIITLLQSPFSLSRFKVLRRNEIIFFQIRPAKLAEALFEAEVLTTGMDALTTSLYRPFLRLKSNPHFYAHLLEIYGTQDL